jgi:hypothetical protein
MIEQQEILDLVEETKSRSKFNLADAIKGRAFPEDTVDIYLDVESAYALSKLSDELIVSFDEADITRLEAKAKELSEKILASKLTFKMRGIDQKRVEELEKENKVVNGIDDNDEWIHDYMSALVAANIVEVIDASGNVDDHTFTGAEITELRGNLSGEAWDVLVGSMQKLTLATGYFKGLTDAGFLQKF